MATSATNPTGTMRRSTRLERTISITVMGVDAWRGPYTESVSTVNVSAHGCKYESAHQVLNDSLVILELKGETEKASRSARGRVKYVKRPASNGQLFQTAIELEDPGNVWGVDDPPSDWLAFCGPKSVELDTSRSKPFALPRPEIEPAAAKDHAEDKEEERKEDKSRKVSRREAERTSPAPSVSSSTQIAGGFQQQLEKILADAAVIAVRDQVKSAFDEMRSNLEEEAKKIVAETARTNADLATEKSIKQLKTVAESVQALHAQWSKQMETQLQQACDKIQLRGREVEEVSEALSASALDKLQRAMEASRRDSVDRIIARLKEQSTPLLENAQRVMAELNRCTQDVSPAIQVSIEESTERIKQTHAQLEKQFDKAIRDRLEAAQTELTRAARAVTIEALNDLRGLSQKHEAEIKARLQKAIEPILEENLLALRQKASETSHEALNDLRGLSQKHEAEVSARLQKAIEPILEENLLALRQKAKETSQQFAGEIDDYSRSHLEFVGSAISELAKGLGKKVRE